MTKELILILGGARSGKSAFGERLARSSERVLFAATAEARDSEMEHRIAAHRGNRPAQWDTVEEPIDLAGVLEPAADSYDTVLVDCLTLWVSNLILQDESGRAEAEALRQVERLLRAYERGRASWVLISNEVGMGVVPPTALGRLFRDALGRVNQLVARRADKVYLMVAGLTMEIKSLGAHPFDLPDGGERE